MYYVGSFAPQLERFAAFFPLFDVSPLYGGSKPRQWEKTDPNAGAAEGCDLLIFGVLEYAKDRSLRQLLQEVKSVECPQISAVRMNHRHKKNPAKSRVF
ncbi:hypothetical protein [Pseudomonas sp. DTU12.3]|uniref:hypothetical protein n=1 Tax=Pseudomonas sp. DTU12.3 TaxID=2073078 RepID=UPI001012422F|nr:hypothetical protein [Pseudomonas sp. DTU12.3]